MPKSFKFISFDSISILDNIGAGTAVNGSFELEILYSDYFLRRHKEMEKEIIADVTQGVMIFDVAYDQASQSLRMAITKKAIHFSSLI